jgi:hypothetical protein
MSDTIPGGEYVLRHKPTGHFFESQNLYLGAAILTESLQKAKKMPLEEAESSWRCMNEQESWQIWSTDIGVILGKESTRHVLNSRKQKLEKELASIEKELGQR